MSDEQKRDLAARIKAHRKHRGLTQEQVAERVGITYGSYVKIENVFQTPSLSTLVKISEVLEVSLDWLVFGRR